VLLGQFDHWCMNRSLSLHQPGTSLCVWVNRGVEAAETRGMIDSTEGAPGSHRLAAPERRPRSPSLASLLAELTYGEDGVPDAESWNMFTEAIDARYRHIDRLERDLSEARRGLASFENLFRISPIPLMEQDYTEVERWMEGLRASGVTSIRDHIDGDVEAIRGVVPMITIVAANPAAAHAVGLPSERMIGPIDPRIVNDGAMPSWLSQLEAVWQRQPEARAAFSAATPDGRTYDAESILAAPVIDGEPDFSRAVFTLMDVTPHRNEERRMEEIVEAKNRFLASVSHEIRTPLTAILGFGHLLEENGVIEEEDRHTMVSSIVQHTQEVVDLIEDLLVAARAEMGEIELTTGTVDVMDQIHRILHAGGSFTTDVHVAGTAGSAVAVADPGRLRQILRNLLTNAERYGGPEVSVTVSAEAGTIVIDVADDGPGLPPAEWERIFEAYHRAHEAPGQPESVGIGLAISRQLAELMGGSLHYFCTADRSVFRLVLVAG
jgi:signal transduction histidine kinase